MQNDSNVAEAMPYQHKSATDLKFLAFLLVHNAPGDEALSGG
jgi:hypothetical protein